MESKSDQSKRTVINFKDIDENFKFIIGRVKHHTVGRPLERHYHPKHIEISYLVTGNQVYTVEGKPYELESGDVFITYPGEYHGSGGYQKDKSRLFYIQIEEAAFEYLGVQAEGLNLLEGLKQDSKRMFKASKRIPVLIETILEQGENSSVFSKTKIRNAMSELIIELIENPQEKEIKANTSMDEIKSYIREHIEEDIAIRDLAQMLQISEGRFKILFKECVGIPPKEYILRQKIAKAKELITQTDESITQIAYRLGFSNSQYFTTVFKRFNLDSPKMYREYSKNVSDKR